MKNYKLLTNISFALLLLGFYSCSKDLLEKFPLSDVSAENFFNTENDLLMYTNSFYNMTNGNSVFSGDIASDNVEQNSVNSLLVGDMEVPETASQAGWDWSDLRNINFFLKHYSKAKISDEEKNHYAGIARFFRAWFYFEKMKRFGDVPWYSQPLETNSEDLFKDRDKRTLITDSIISDLDFAIAHLSESKNVSRVNKWTALALKSRVCLFEGTFRKYHEYNNLQTSYKDLLKMAIAASEAIMNSNNFKLYSTDTPERDYLDLFSSENAKIDEVIFAEVYSTSLKKFHAANSIFNVGTTGGGVGLTKDFIDSYLLIDGEPFSTLSGFDTLTFTKEIKNRDYRLYQTIRTPGYKRIGGEQTLLPDFNAAPTGYQVIKFVSGVNEDNYNTNSNDIPLFRYAEVLLNFAEAKVELGIATQSDMDKSINLLRRRVGMPNMDLMNITHDPVLAAQYPNIIDDKILEVRRERRIELAMEGFRYYDIMRWKNGKIFEKVFRGMYFPNKGEFDLDGDGINDFAILDQLPSQKKPNIQYFILGKQRLSEGNKGNVLTSPNVQKIFIEPKNYLYPLPREQMVLNPNLKQNAGWD